MSTVVVITLKRGKGELFAGHREVLVKKKLVEKDPGFTVKCKKFTV